MLHRTQAIQVLMVYERFMEFYPDLQALNQASKEQLYDLLQSIGLNWRIDLIPKMAHELIVRFDGHIPHDKTALLSLPGVSSYIASAVRCFTWNLPETLIDTNTTRVIGRLFGLEIKDSSRRNPIFRESLAKPVDPDKPKIYTYALLDLANQICTKRKPPNCSSCPVLHHCLYGINALGEGV